MKKLSLTLAALVSLTTFASIDEATVLKVSKNVNEGNVLHYKIEFDSTRCEFTSDIYAEWKMDEEDGRWKSLSESIGMIRAPLEPSTSIVSENEINFETESMTEFRNKKILSSSRVEVFIEPDAHGCHISTEAIVKGRRMQLNEIKSHLNWTRTSVKKITILGEDENGRRIQRDYK
jgi:hypothetical protein